MTHPQPIARIESLDFEGRGVAHVDGKTLFIDGGLPYETVRYSSYRKEPIRKRRRGASAQRQLYRHHAALPAFWRAAAVRCSMWNSPPRWPISSACWKTIWLHIGRVTPEVILPLIYGPLRLSPPRPPVGRHVPKKGGVLVGFRESAPPISPTCANAIFCPERIFLLMPLRELIGQWSIVARMPQVELAVGDAVDVLVFRIMDPLTAADEALLRQFIDAHATPQRRCKPGCNPRRKPVIRSTRWTRRR